MSMFDSLMTLSLTTSHDTSLSSTEVGAPFCLQRVLVYILLMKLLVV